MGPMQSTISTDGSKRWVLVAALATCAVASAAMMSATSAPAYAASHHAGAIETTATGTFAKGDTFSVSGNVYRINDYDVNDDELGEVTLVKYGSKKTTALINTVSYKGEVFEVDVIGKNAFNNARGHKVKSLTLGRHVGSIKTKAFYGCTKLKKLDMAKSDAIDIERNRSGYYIDDIDVGSNAFKNAGTSKLKVHCGSNNKTYKALFKKALVKKGMRSNVTVVK